MLLLFILGGILIALFIVAWTLYNRIIQAKNIVSEGFSGIDVQLKRRFELIPNLIEAVKGYNAHEAKVLEEIVANRSMSLTDINAIAQSDQSITSTLKNFRIHVEDYPDLQANTQFLKLMDNLSEIESELSMARRYYNGTVRDYNTKIQIFPGVLVANMMKLKPAVFYQIEHSEERLTPNVDIHE